MNKKLLAIIPVVLVIAAVAVMKLGLLGKKTDMIVSLSLHDVETYLSGCQFGQGGYGDIGVGTSVTLKGSSGDVIAVGSLHANTLGGFARNGTDFEKIDAGVCNFLYTFEGIPADEDSYVLTIGSGSRGDVVFTNSEVSSIRDDKFLAEITLGS